MFYNREGLSTDPKERFAVFKEAGMLDRIPTRWQLLQGDIEMAPYVVLPDAGDDDRYSGTLFGHPLLRTPIVLYEVGLDHFQVGHGLGAAPESLFRHLAIVYHEGMPIFDLQLVQTVPDGLPRLRRFLEEIEEGSSPHRRRQRRRIDLVVPEASAYRRNFLEPGGWIDRAEAFDYPNEAELADFLRPEFASLVGFAKHCAEDFPASPPGMPVRALPRHLLTLLTRAFREGYGKERSAG